MILYVEQHEDSRHMLVLLLGLYGHEVKTAATPVEALRVARQQWFDLYILENRFPDISGVELCRQIRALHPKTPIIFYSSASYSRDIEAGLAAGAQRYLTKPADIEIIQEAVAELLLDTRDLTMSN
jgi:two-component system, OmpR family, catabolic regulation response regulator CreB